MAKESKLVRNAERARLSKVHAKRRADLVAILKDPNAGPEAKDAAYARLYKMPRDASGTRFRNRCHVSGRPRGYIGKAGVSRVRRHDDDEEDRRGRNRRGAARMRSARTISSTRLRRRWPGCWPGATSAKV